MALDSESTRLLEDEKRKKNWKRWGPYLSDRQWGTVREDYSSDGSCWNYLTHDHSRSRAYRWGEDGIFGLTDRECRLCFAPAFWNGKDSILKERLFGLTGPEGNNGEDVKECYYYLDSTPTHSYLKALYKYPQEAFPYERLLHESQIRSRGTPEFELTDTGIFDNDRYFDIFVEYAKNGANDILIRVTVHNRGDEEKEFHIIPTVWFRNSWSWGRVGEGYTVKPSMRIDSTGMIETMQPTLGKMCFAADPKNGTQIPLFTENETNLKKLFNAENSLPYVKDSFHDYIVRGIKECVNPNLVGTKASFYSKCFIPPKGSKEYRYRLYHNDEKPPALFGEKFSQTFTKRISEANEFYSLKIPQELTPEEKNVSRQAYAGLLWSKQFYYYSVREWLEGDPSQPTPDPTRATVRNIEWKHLYNRDIISMPDKWEYPWYAAWDLAFHVVAFANIDPHFAKKQLILFLREWYMHPNGQIPAYEFAFSDVNPPVHAWACWRVYKLTGPRGKRDREFLARTFQKLLINFTWWVNRKDISGNNLFSGGFLGLDNIGVFDRSAPLPLRGRLEQADGTAWMAFYATTMLSMALELASEDSSYGDLASKFFEHFISITEAMNNFGGTGLWDEQDGFYYDQLYIEGSSTPVRVRSLVGIIPLLAVGILQDYDLTDLHGFKRRLDWFLTNRQDLSHHLSYLEYRTSDKGEGMRILAVPSRERLTRMLKYILDEKEFLSPYGIRSMSRIHLEHPYTFSLAAQEYRVQYAPGESNSLMFGGNSNWRGPIWFPTNYLVIEALERYNRFYGDEFKVEYPTGSGTMLTLGEIAQDLSSRLSKLFLNDEAGKKPCYGNDKRYTKDKEWSDLCQFYEYFNGDSGLGLGSSHQTGWTALVTGCLDRIAAGRRGNP